MDAVEFLKEWERMCDSTKCESCGLLNSLACGGMPFGEVDFDEMVAVVQKWSKEHPLVTNGGEVMRMLPEEAIVSDEWLNTVTIRVPRKWWDAEYKEKT